MLLPILTEDTECIIYFLYTAVPFRLFPVGYFITTTAAPRTWYVFLGTAVVRPTILLLLLL